MTLMPSLHIKERRRVSIVKSNSINNSLKYSYRLTPGRIYYHLHFKHLYREARQATESVKTALSLLATTWVLGPIWYNVTLVKNNLFVEQYVNQLAV